MLCSWVPCCWFPPSPYKSVWRIPPELSSQARWGTSMSVRPSGQKRYGMEDKHGYEPARMARHRGPAVSGQADQLDLAISLLPRPDASDLLGHELFLLPCRRNHPVSADSRPG